MVVILQERPGLVCTYMAPGRRTVRETPAIANRFEQCDKGDFDSFRD